nr:MAG TPA: hypothetical protein [Caudoviricetes sp.]
MLIKVLTPTYYVLVYTQTTQYSELQHKEE